MTSPRVPDNDPPGPLSRAAAGAILSARVAAFRVRDAFPGRVIHVSERPEEEQRQVLLEILFGPKVPSVLEGQMLRTSDVAVLFEVSERTVSEWAKRGQIPSVRTPGGHRRYPADGIRYILEESRRSPESRSVGTSAAPYPPSA
jgi:excisionase family DNA binding protein